MFAQIGRRAESGPLGDPIHRLVTRLEEAAPVDQLLAAFGALRRVNVDLMRQLRPADWDRTGAHGEQGREDVRTMLEKVAGHDLAHLNQLQRTIEVLPSRVAD